MEVNSLFHTIICVQIKSMLWNIAQALPENQLPIVLHPAVGQVIGFGQVIERIILLPYIVASMGAVVGEQISRPLFHVIVTYIYNPSAGIIGVDPIILANYDTEDYQAASTAADAGGSLIRMLQRVFESSEATIDPEELDLESYFEL